MKVRVWTNTKYCTSHESFYKKRFLTVIDNTTDSYDQKLLKRFSTQSWEVRIEPVLTEAIFVYHSARDGFLQKWSSSMNKMKMFCIKGPFYRISSHDGFIDSLRLIFLNRNPIPERREWCRGAWVRALLWLEIGDPLTLPHRLILLNSITGKSKSFMWRFLNSLSMNLIDNY